jgi:trehalose-6-phosphatase
MKITTDKYMIYQEGGDYILNLGMIKKGDDTTTNLMFEDLKNSATLNVRPTCGCTVVEKEVLTSTSAKAKVKYNDCVSSFSKTMTCSADGIYFNIKIKGTCL